MRIQSLPPQSLTPDDKPAPAGNPRPAQSPSDHVELSRLSQALTGEAASDVRLEELGALAAEGTYEVPAAELSRRMVDALLGGHD